METFGAPSGTRRSSILPVSLGRVTLAAAFLALVAATTLVTGFTASRAKVLTLGNVLLIGPDVTGRQRLSDGSELSVNALPGADRVAHLRDALLISGWLGRSSQEGIYR